ncbi:helix-turn-helix transcriptional regulator [Arthrobacter polaris]|uniref:helix-turn-helix transcriptional regulator n=1 Tax=Arthrobacter polaris TaxID=2813727 RepID=UPI001F2DD7BB|nr:helix-turn-helix domain-containing protein [Arthrobacter polaris]UIK88997.1 MarR family transcriptional regulator [Arthrobacter polaris]
MSEWGFMTNHLHALYCVARHPGIRIREIAESVGVQERAAHRIVADLVEGGYLTRRRVGSRNFYELHPTLPLRREGLDEVAVGEILDVLLGTEAKRPEAHGSKSGYPATSTLATAKKPRPAPWAPSLTRGAMANSTARCNT